MKTGRMTVEKGCRGASISLNNIATKQHNIFECKGFGVFQQSFGCINLKLPGFHVIPMANTHKRHLALSLWLHCLDKPISLRVYILAGMNIFVSSEQTHALDIR